MNYNIEKILEKTPLFLGIPINEIKKIRECFSVILKTYKKDEYIVLEGTPMDFIGIIVSGRVFMEKEDSAGNKYLYTEIYESNIFGEVYISNHIKNSTVNYKAITESQILFIQYNAMIHICNKNCESHRIVLENLLGLTARNNRILIEKIEIISKKSIREKILTYLTILKRTQHTSNITSKLNHTEMAEFLCVNRSSMIRELKRMEKEELLHCDKNQYFLNQDFTEV